MVDYAKLAKTAKRLITANGRSIDFIRKNQTPTDPNKPWKGDTLGETSVTLQGVFVPPSALRQLTLPSLGEGTQFKDLVAFSEQIIIVFPEDQELKDFEAVSEDGVRWGITAVQTLKPARIALLGFVGVRR